jgi:hypothetical protein
MKAEGKDVVPLGTPKPKGKKKKKQVQASDRVDLGSGREVIPPKGTSKSDAEQIKPGAGLEAGEVIADLKQKSIIKADEPIAVAAATSATGKTTGKRKLSFRPWRGRDSSSSVRKGKQASEQGRFVEHLGSEGVGGSKQET